MKIWTIQDRRVLDTIDRVGVYYPDFTRSNFLESDSRMEELRDLYMLVLNSFNKCNRCDYEGLAFAFLGYEDYFDFEDGMICNKFSIKDLWNKFLRDDYVILELEYEEDFNLISIDINDFQALMPPMSINLPSYKGDVIPSILENIRNGRFPKSTFPSGIVQGHIPYIASENVVSTYQIFSLIES